MEGEPEHPRGMSFKDRGPHFLSHQYLHLYSQSHLLGLGNPSPQRLAPGTQMLAPSPLPTLRLRTSRAQEPCTLHLAPVKARGAQEAVADRVETTPPSGSPDATARAWGRRGSRGSGGAGPGRVQGRVQGGPPGGARGAWGAGQWRGAGTGGRGLLPGAPTPGAPRRQRLRFGSRRAPAPSLISSPGLW